MKYSQRLPTLCLLNQRILALSADVIVWELPAQIRPLRLGVAGSQPCEIEAPWPRLLICAKRCSHDQVELRVIAVRRKGRILPKTPTFHAPLMNVSEDGIFTPSAPYGRIDPMLIEEYETYILDNIYSATGHGSTMRLPGVIDRGSVSSYQNMREWRSLAREGVNRFPGGMLTPRKQTVDSWLQEIDSAKPRYPNVFELVVSGATNEKKEAAL